MKLATKLRHTPLSVMTIVLALLLGLGWGQLTKPARANSPSSAFPVQGFSLPLQVQAVAAQGFAAPGNNLPANFLAVVTDLAGAPVTTLTQADFQIIDHFSVPGQTCGFTNNIVSFNNVHNGAYQIQVTLHNLNPQVLCAWVAGDYLAQVIVRDGARQGQTPTTLSIKCPQTCGL